MFLGKLLAFKRLHFTHHRDERAQQIKPANHTATWLTRNQTTHKPSHRSFPVVPFCHLPKANNLQSHFTGYDLEQGIYPGTGIELWDLFFLCSQEAFPPLSAHRSMGRVQMRPWVTAGERLSQVRTFLTADGEWFGLGYDLATSFRKRGPTSSIQSRQETEGAGDTCSHGFPEGIRLLRGWWPGQGSMLQPWKKTSKNPSKK